MTLRNRGEPSGFPRIAAGLIARAMRRANLNDLKRLKSLLEGVSESTTPGRKASQRDL
jgi:hypothetical protein